MSYPSHLSLKDCVKGPSQGGLPIAELKDLAIKMGINPKLVKAEICAEIAKKIGKDVNEAIKVEPQNEAIKVEPQNEAIKVVQPQKAPQVVLSHDECYGWIQCGKKVKYNDIDIWEIPENTVLYKGVSELPDVSDKPPPPNKYIADPNWIVDDYTYLASRLETALLYAYDNTGRVISVITTKPLRLLDLNNEDTINYVMDNCKGIAPFMTIAFSLRPGRPKRVGDKLVSRYVSGQRVSDIFNDFKLAEELRKCFPWIDGYGFDSNTKTGFHEEMLLFNPSKAVKRYPLEYRWAGVGIRENEFPLGNVIEPYMFKVLNGQIINGFFAPRLQKVTKAEEDRLINWRDPRESMNQRPNILPYKVNPMDSRDKFLVDRKGDYYKTAQDIMMSDAEYKDRTSGTTVQMSRIVVDKDNTTADQLRDITGGEVSDRKGKWIILSDPRSHRDNLHELEKAGIQVLEEAIVDGPAKSPFIVHMYKFD